MGYTGILLYLNQATVWYAPSNQGALEVRVDDLKGTARRAAQFWLLQESDAIKTAIIAELIATTASTAELVRAIATPADALVRSTDLYKALEGF